MKAQVKLGRIAGISIGLHYSWFIIALLIALSLAQHFRGVAPRWSTTVVWTAAVVTGVLFFAALLLHELAHSLLAKARGLRVRAITLFALGGVSQIESEEVKAKSADGTMVPLSIIHKRGIAMDGSHPTWLEGYGAYGITLDPTFRPTWLAFLERGGVFAVAHVRGGGEYGEDWHNAGRMLTNSTRLTIFLPALNT